MAIEKGRKVTVNQPVFAKKLGFHSDVKFSIHSTRTFLELIQSP